MKNSCSFPATFLSERCVDSDGWVRGAAGNSLKQQSEIKRKEEEELGHSSVRRRRLLLDRSTTKSLNEKESRQCVVLCCAVCVCVCAKKEK